MTPAQHDRPGGKSLIPPDDAGPARARPASNASALAGRFVPYRNKAVIASWLASLAFAGLILAAVIGSRIVDPASGPFSSPAAEPSDFNSRIVEPPRYAPQFELTNHRGEPFSLADHTGKVVVLTFLYTSCTDVCPFIGQRLKLTMSALGDTTDVTFVAVSVDPERDTRDRAAEYSRRLGLFDDWEYLVGGRSELDAVWDSYFIGPEPWGDSHLPSLAELHEAGVTDGLSQIDVTEADRVRREFGGGEDIDHITPVWVIDRWQRIRLVAGEAFVPEELARDIERLLLGE